MRAHKNVTTGKQRVDISTTEGIEQLSKRIRASYFAITKGGGESDDCVQEVLCRMLEGKHKHSTVDQCVIDYLRFESGRKGTASYTGRINLKYASPIGPRVDEPKTEVDYGGELDTRELIAFIEEGGRGILGEVLRMNIQEKTLKEIGERFGFSESRASQLLSQAVLKLQVLAGLPKEVRKWAAKYVL